MQKFTDWLIHLLTNNKNTQMGMKQTDKVICHNHETEIKKSKKSDNANLWKRNKAIESDESVYIFIHISVKRVWVWVEYQLLHNAWMNE